MRGLLYKGKEKCLFAPAFKQPADFAVMNDSAVAEEHHRFGDVVKLHVDHVSEVEDYFLRGHNPETGAIIGVKAASRVILGVDEALDDAEEAGLFGSLFPALLDVVFFCIHRNGFLMLFLEM